MYDIYIFLIFILFFAGVLLKGLTKRNLMDLNMSTHCLCQLKTKSNQRIHVQRNLKIVHFIAFIQYDRYINAAILIHTIFTKKYIYISSIFFCMLSTSNFLTRVRNVTCIFEEFCAHLLFSKMK